LGYIGETQYIFRMPEFSLLAGGGYYGQDVDGTTITNTTEGTRITGTSENIQHGNGYIYSYLHLPNKLTLTLGLSFDSYSDSVSEYDQPNPKLGLLWNATPDTTLRLAALRMFKRSLVADQTIEPTQVAGFNQFFDDPTRTDARRYGLGLDHKFSSNLLAGAELSMRDLRIPLDFPTRVEVVRWKEESLRGYLD